VQWFNYCGPLQGSFFHVSVVFPDGEQIGVKLVGEPSWGIPRCDDPGSVSFTVIGPVEAK
jgi:hypothetical protein